LYLPVQWALDNKEVFDVIVIYTDSESWAGSRQLPSVWEDYRKKVNPNAKLVIASTASNIYTVGDPKDTSVLQTVGFDGNLLEVIKGWATS
jgi:60 kDa SS-A/Ro ribonucleoprotein